MADYGQQPSGPEEEIPSGVLPDDLLRYRSAVEHDAVLRGRLACAGREGADMFVDLGAGTKPYGDVGQGCGSFEYFNII